MHFLSLSFLGVELGVKEWFFMEMMSSVANFEWSARDFQGCWNVLRQKCNCVSCCWCKKAHLRCLWNVLQAERLQSNPFGGITSLNYITHIKKLIRTHTLADYSHTCTSRLKMPTKIFRMLFGGKRLDTMSKCCMVQNCSRFARSSNCWIPFGQQAGFAADLNKISNQQTLSQQK